MAKRRRVSVKADFIRAFPFTVPPRQVLAQAAAAGFSLTRAHVHGVRRQMAKEQGVPTPGAIFAMRSKRAFVLSFPLSMPARWVLAAAKAEGIELTRGYLYWLRSDAVRRGLISAGESTVSAARAPAASAVARVRSQAEAERMLVDVAARRVGFDRALLLLQAVRERLARALTG